MATRFISLFKRPYDKVTSLEGQISAAFAAGTLFASSRVVRFDMGRTVTLLVEQIRTWRYLGVHFFTDPEIAFIMVLTIETGNPWGTVPDGIFSATGIHVSKQLSKWDRP
jgi:hypothetical protein